MADASAPKSVPEYRTPAASQPAPRIKGVHHAAWRCRDAAETRWFYETVCGLELEAALALCATPDPRRSTGAGSASSI